MTSRPPLYKRFIKALIERRGMNAYANVMSGRKPKWYARPFGWVAPLTLFALVAGTVLWEVFRYVGIPLLVVCMFVTLHRMNDKVDAIDQRIESKDCASDIADWIQRNIEIGGHLQKWTWSCTWSIHGGVHDYDTGSFNKSVSGCGAGEQPWKEHRLTMTRVEALAARDKHNTETGHKAYIAERMILTPVPKTETK